MLFSNPGPNGHARHCHQHWMTGDPRDPQALLNHTSAMVQPDGEAAFIDANGMEDPPDMYYQDAAMKLASSGCGAQSCFLCPNPVAADGLTSHCSHCMFHVQPLQNNSVDKMYQVHFQGHHHVGQCMSTVYEGRQMPEKDPGLSDNVPSALEIQADEEPVEYEYYVWDAAAQEYVQTDQKTGEKMLQDPQYFQYHYRLVENRQSGEAHLLSEHLNERGCEEYREFELPSMCRANSDERVEAFKGELGDGSGSPQRGARLLSTPEAVLTPPRRLYSPPPLSSRVGCLDEAQPTQRCCCGACEKENQATYAPRADRRSPDKRNPRGKANASGCCESKVFSRWHNTPSSVGPSSSQVRSLMSCSRPWEGASASVRNGELRARQLRYLQRVQQLEKEELVRRQRILDEMAATLPRSPKHRTTSELSGRAQPSLPSDLRTLGKKPNRPSVSNGLLSGDKRVRSDPVSRGHYFRTKWKSDRFLEHQRHPAFDVKAYDAWLKNRGHLLRARALELQQEEQRLLFMLQQEKCCR